MKVQEGNQMIGEEVTSQASEKPSTSSDGEPHGQVVGSCLATTYVSGHRCEAAVGQQVSVWEEELDVEQRKARTNLIL